MLCNVYNLLTKPFTSFIWAIPGPFFVFSIQLTLNKRSVLKFANDWIRIADLWCRKRPLYQLSQTTAPIYFVFILTASNLDQEGLSWAIHLGV